MRKLLGTLAAAALLTGAAAPAKAQGLVEYALILVLALEKPANDVAIESLELAVEKIERSARFDQDCEMSPDLEPVCDAVDKIQPGDLAARAGAILQHAQWNFENAWPVKVTGPQQKSDGNTFGLDEIITTGTAAGAAGAVAVRNFGCGFSSNGVVTRFVQEVIVDGGLPMPQPADGAGERCVDILQDALSKGQRIQSAVPVPPRPPDYFGLQTGDDGDPPPTQVVRFVYLYTLSPP